MSGWSPQPGWYQDPAGGPGWRWWDGAAWTANTRPEAPTTGTPPGSTPAAYPTPGYPTAGYPPTGYTPPGYPPTGYTPPGYTPPGYTPPAYTTGGYPQPGSQVGSGRPSAPELLAAEKRVAGWAAYAAAAAGAVQCLALLLVWTQISAWRQYLHAVRVILDNAGTPGYVAPAFPTQPAGQGVGLLILVPGILFLLWQLRAAEVARALGYPAKHAPGWGVGSWFVPVVNLWIPYGALRDCLSPGHRRRRFGWVPWVLYLLNNVLVIVAELALAEATGVGVVLSMVVVGVYLYVAWRAYGLVKAVGEDHGEALELLGGGSTL